MLIPRHYFFVLHDGLPEPLPESLFCLPCFQYVFKAEAHGFRTVHEELAKGMTFDLKSNEHSAVRNVLKVSLFPHLILIMWQSLMNARFEVIKNPLPPRLGCSSPVSSLS